MSRMVKVMAIVIVVGGILKAQSGPSWLQMGNLPDAGLIYDILEISNTSIVIAVGRSRYISAAAMWRSTDGGHTWNMIGRYDGFAFSELQFDTTRNILFAMGNVSYRLYYSTDWGNSWHEIYYPYFVGYQGVSSSALINGKLYVGFYIYMRGIYSVFYPPLLLRLDYSDPDTNNWHWELICQYPELQDTAGVFQLLYKDNKLFVFGEDKGGNGIRIYTYDISTLDKMAKPIGTVAEMAEYWKKHKEELADNKRPNREIKGMSTSAPVEFKK